MKKKLSKYLVFLLSFLLGIVGVWAIDFNIDTVFDNILNTSLPNKVTLNFNYWGNDFGGFMLLWKLEKLDNPVNIVLWNNNKTCHLQLKGIYFSNQRWLRLWPLSYWMFEQIRNTIGTNYNSLSMTWWLYMWCDDIKDEYVYWEITYNINWTDYKLLAGGAYDFTMNKYNWVFDTSLKIDPLNTATWYIFDSYWGIAKINWDVNICVDHTWMPSANTVCNDTSFTQKSNCDNTQIVQWTKICDSGSGNSWWGGWGWSSLTKDDCPDWDFSASYYDKDCWTNNNSWSWVDDNSWNNTYFSGDYWDDVDVEWLIELTDESKLICAYLTNLGIWFDCLEIMREDYHLNRIKMAELTVLLSQKELNRWAINQNIWCYAYGDISDLSSEEKSFAITACNMWIMGLHSDGKTPKDNFDPLDIVTRAELGTVLSRLIWNEKYDNNTTDLRYKDHLDALNKDGIIQYIDNPYRKEIYSYAVLMLMRIKNKIEDMR